MSLYLFSILRIVNLSYDLNVLTKIHGQTLYFARRPVNYLELCGRYSKRIKKVENVKISDGIYLIGSGDVGISNSLDCHVFLLADKEGLAMIDAGSGADTDQILSNIVAEGFEPHDVRYLFLTHCHSDHASGGSDVRSKTSCEVVASVQETPFVEHASDERIGLNLAKKANWYPQDFVNKDCKVDRSIGENETLELGKCQITPLILPGHSWGVLCLLVKLGNRRLFFSSDSVFINGTIGLGNWPGCSLRSYRENISKVRDLMVDELYPGHFLWTLREGQKHLEKAADNLTYGWVPPINGHNHPVY